MRAAVTVATPPRCGHVNVQVARAWQRSAGFYVTLLNASKFLCVRVCVCVCVCARVLVWNRALFVFGDRVFVRAQCRGLTVANRFLMGEVLKKQ